MQITGEFSVELKTLETRLSGLGKTTLGRMSIAKRFNGGLEGTSKGEMLHARTPVEGSAGYVAIEHVSGTMAGRQGEFVLQHFGIMSDGSNRLVLEVVPGSGTGDLLGLSGEMQIRVEEGKHFYDFDYAISS